MQTNIPEHLIVRYLSGEATPEEEKQLFQWVNQHEDHQDIFTEWLYAWKEEPACEHKFPLQEGLSRLNARVDQLEEEERNRTYFPFRKLVAASVAILLMALCVFYLYNKYGHVDQQVILAERKTGPGQNITIRLGDGSTVKLNSNSIVKYPEVFNESSREVYLEGEAFFDVAKDPQRPFVVYTGEVSTRVLGTSFNVQTSDKHVSVSVATGKVEVTHVRQERQLLVPNEKVVWEKSTRQFRRSTTNLEHDLAWLSNTILFEDTSLDEVALILERRYGVSIAFENNALKKCTVTGKFRNESLNTILRAVELSTHIHFRLRDRAVILHGEGCP